MEGIPFAIFQYRPALLHTTSNERVVPGLMCLFERVLQMSITVCDKLHFQLCSAQCREAIMCYWDVSKDKWDTKEDTGTVSP